MLDTVEIPPVELVVFLCYGRSMKETKELDQDVFKEVMKIWRQEQEKLYWREIKSLNKKKRKIERNGRKKLLF